MVDENENLTNEHEGQGQDRDTEIDWVMHEYELNGQVERIMMAVLRRPIRPLARLEVKTKPGVQFPPDVIEAALKYKEKKAGE